MCWQERQPGQLGCGRAGHGVRDCCGLQDDPTLLVLHQTQPALRSGSCPSLAPSFPDSIPSSHHQRCCLDPATAPLSCCVAPLPPARVSLCPHCSRPSFQNCRQGTLTPMEGQSSAGSQSKGPEPSTCLPGPGDKGWVKPGEGGICTRQRLGAAGREPPHFMISSRTPTPSCLPLSHTHRVGPLGKLLFVQGFQPGGL